MHTMKKSTAQVAKILGMQQPHLQRAIRQGRVEAPKLTTVGAIKIRLWSKADIDKARKALGK